MKNLVYQCVAIAALAGVPLLAGEGRPGPVALVDTAHSTAASRLGPLSQWVDSFFEDPDYTAEEADARISVRQAVDLGEDVDYRIRISGALSLPNLSRRTKLVFEGNDDARFDELEEEHLRDAASRSIDVPALGLQYRFLTEGDYDLRMTAGVRVRDASLYGGPRFRARIALGDAWGVRFTQRLRAYTSDVWRSDSRVDVERQVGEGNLFRQSFGTTWLREDGATEGFRHSASSTLTQPLSSKRALRYDWTTSYRSGLDEGWEGTRVAVSYRRRVWRDWMSVEVTPYLNWEADDDWQTQLGVVLSLAIIIEDDELSPPPQRP